MTELTNAQQRLNIKQVSHWKKDLKLQLWPTCGQQYVCVCQCVWHLLVAVPRWWHCQNSFHPVVVFLVTDIFPSCLFHIPFQTPASVGNYLQEVQWINFALSPIRIPFRGVGIVQLKKYLQICICASVVMPILFYGCFQEECIVYNIEMSWVQHLILKQCLNTHNLVDRMSTFYISQMNKIRNLDLML